MIVEQDNVFAVVDLFPNFISILPVLSFSVHKLVVDSELKGLRELTK